MNQPDPPLITRAELRLALTTGLSAGLAITLGLPDVQYGPLAVGAVLGGTVGASRTLGIQRMLGTLMGGVILVVLYPTLSPILPLPIGVAIGLACTRLFGGSLGLHSGYKVAGFVVGVGWTAHAASITTWVPLRLLQTLVGVLIAWAAIRWFWPSRAIDQRQKLSVRLFGEFATALREQAALFRQGDVLRGPIALERRNHLLGLILDHQNQRADAFEELNNDHLGERLARLWDRQESLWSELISSYRSLLRLPPLPRHHHALARLVEAEASLLEAAADRLDQWAGCWPRPPRRGLGAEGEGDSLSKAARDLDGAEQGLFQDAEASAVLLSGSEGRRPVACSQVKLALESFEAAWRATP